MLEVWRQLDQTAQIAIIAGLFGVILYWLQEVTQRSHWPILGWLRSDSSVLRKRLTALAAAVVVGGTAINWDLSKWREGLSAAVGTFVVGQLTHAFAKQQEVSS